ncbi:MAG: hypothetical protein FJY88_01250 [Candidatus Eisenbacteria bacterium]|nr:hypothetical protein [Candidatus Eisenbacteria bacterium]
MTRIRPVVWLLLLAVLAGAGCYTVLRHPEPMELTEEDGSSKACSDCHADADLYHYAHEYDVGWYQYYPAPWAVYYSSPWWYDSYWYYPPHDPDPGLPQETGGRSLWSRGSTSDSNPLPIQGGTGALPPAGLTSPDKPKPGETTQPPKEEKKDKEKRRLWGR